MGMRLGSTATISIGIKQDWQLMGVVIVFRIDTFTRSIS
jgi:hypothetical protein